MIEEEKKTITGEKHPSRVARSHKLAALMKKRKEEILCNKEQSTEQCTVRSIEQYSVQSTEQPTVYSTVKWSLCLWHWYTCCPCHWGLCIFCI